jgi:predicted dehydrogenase
MVTNSMIRIGLLGTAKVAEYGLVKAAANTGEVALVAVAARDGGKAAHYADKHGIAASYCGYQRLLDQPDIDAVYLPLSNHVHEEWAIKALQAGKHVLCEKPLAPNAASADRIRQEAARHQLVIWEGFAFRHHPFWQRVLSLLPELGEIKHIQANYCMPIPDKSWNVYNYDHAGGSMMDTGCYTVNMARQIAQHASNGDKGLEPNVTSATALLLKGDARIDRAMQAHLDWGNGMTGAIHSSIWSRSLVKISLHVQGEHGSLHAYNPILPWFWNRITLKKAGKTVREKIAGGTTFEYQLRNFAEAVQAAATPEQRLDDAVSNMRVIDEIYRKAGLPLR